MILNAAQEVMFVAVNLGKINKYLHILAYAMRFFLC